MRFPLIAVILLILNLGILPAMADREIGLVRVLAQAHTLAELNKAIASAQGAEVHKQIITEAKLLFGLRTQDTQYLVSLLPELDAAALNFSPQQSLAGLASAEQLRGLISYVRALSAMEHKDADGFRDSINEALWNCPQKAGLFGDLVEQFQLREKMARWSVDFSTPLLESGAKETTLSKVLGHQKGLLLIYWAESSPGSLAALPAVQKIADTVAVHGIVVAGINLDRADAESKAESVRNENKLKLPWLIEPEDRPLASLLEINDLPRAVLITQQGRVVFHGHPLEPNMWRSMRKLVPAIPIPEQ